MALEAAEQIANMMVMEPYPGFEGKSFSMPCRNVVPKPVQKPHPPMWMACTNRDTIKVAAAERRRRARLLLRRPARRRGSWAEIYYGIIKSDDCVPLGHAVNANIAMVSSFSVHRDRAEAIRRGQEGFEFFGYAVNALVAHDAVPGRSNLCARDFQSSAATAPTSEIIAAHQGVGAQSPTASARPTTCATTSRGLPDSRRRPGDLPAAGRPQPPRAHLRVAGAVRRRGDARRSRPRRRRARRARPRSSRPTSPPRSRASRG